MPIKRCVIYPAIGIARVGNAPTAYNLSPELPGQVAPPPYKDEEGRVKRQAVRFRIYAYDENDNVVQEIVANEQTQINWTVHLANRKAAWYQFQNAMDMGDKSLSALFRNGSFTGDERKQLIIDPGRRSISGQQTNPDGSDNAYAFNTGTFKGKPVYIGELRTDANGRLLVLGGHGHSAPGGTGYTVAPTFANNDNWHDDIADGPVYATIRIGDETFEAEPAMAVVTPPNFGQGLYGAVTMYDVVENLYNQQGWRPLPERPNFWQHIYPIFERIVQTQWVNQGFFFLFGQSSPSDFTNPDYLAYLANPSEDARPAREHLLQWFRDPNSDEPRPAQIPPFYGDAFGEFNDMANVELAVTPTQYAWLEQWADGNFDPEPPAPLPNSLEELPLNQQPEALTRTHLEDCLGGPFHPGIEMTWTLRRGSMWDSNNSLPFRLNVLPKGTQPQDDFGPVLTPEICLGANGPLQASGAGTITRWMGVPWQTDESSCLSGYDASTYLPLPSFWAARVPNEVYSEKAYERTLKTAVPLPQRLKHFGYRQFWLRDLQGGTTQVRTNNMIAKWHLMGIVQEKPGPNDAEESDLPTRMWVEVGRSPVYNAGDPTFQQVIRAEEGELPPAGMSLPEDSADQHALDVTELASVDKTAVEPKLRRRTRARGEH